MPKNSPQKRSRKRSTARGKILQVASDLFYREGIRAVGVETIVSKAEVAKISLYRNFESKDDLIAAYLSERGEAFLRHWDETFDRFEDPRAKLRAIMNYLMQRTSQPDYRGCPFINFCAEFSDRSHPGRAVARATKAALRNRLFKLAELLGVDNPQQTGDGLVLLVEGAYALSQTLGGGKNGAGHALLAAAEALVDGQRKS